MIFIFNYDDQSQLKLLIFAATLSLASRARSTSNKWRMQRVQRPTQIDVTETTDKYTRFTVQECFEREQLSRT